MCFLALTIFFSYSVAGLYGLAIAAIGMISNLACLLTIKTFCPIVDNAAGIAKFAQFDCPRWRAKMLVEIGLSSSFYVKGFSIGSSTLVSLALLGAFALRINMGVINIL